MALSDKRLISVIYKNLSVKNQIMQLENGQKRWDI